MDRYKISTTSLEHFGDRAAELQALEAKGRKVVPILDPGVKVETGYEVAASGLRAGIFCERRTQHNDLADLDLHVVLGEGCAAEAVLHYVADDGASHAYRRGERSECTFQARRLGEPLHLSVSSLRQDWRPLRMRVVGYDGAGALELTTPSGHFRMPFAPLR